MKKSYKLIFPQSLIREPVMFTMAKNYDIVPNIRRARVTDTFGEMVVELEGAEENIAKALQAMSSQGIEIENIDPDDEKAEPGMNK
jgi:L-aspartate semialdehyde sulfurtransferase ferredoxin